MLGDELDKSMLLQIWEDRYSGKWIKQGITNPRQRGMSTNDRLTVCYFDKHRDASFKRFQDTSEAPLVSIANFLSQTYPQFENYIWTTNERFKKSLNELLNGRYILPKAHGRNDLIHFDVCLWLAAMKSNFIDCPRR